MVLFTGAPSAPDPGKESPGAPPVGPAWGRRRPNSHNGAGPGRRPAACSRIVEGVKDNYLLDVGDYVKFSLLRALMGDPDHAAPSRRLGVLWYRTDHVEANNDGMKLSHLTAPGYEALDPPLLALMREMKTRVDTGEPRVLELLEGSPVLPGAVHCFESLPPRSRDGVALHRQAARRREERPLWFSRSHARVAHCDIVFADPDNGLMPAGRQPGSPDEDKSIRFDELAALVDTRLPGPGPRSPIVVVYHHMDRTAGGWEVALGAIRTRLATHGIADALVGHLDARLGVGRAFLVFTRDPGERAHCQAAAAALLARAAGARRIAGKLTWRAEDFA